MGERVHLSGGGGGGAQTRLLAVQNIFLHASQADTVAGPSPTSDPHTVNVAY